MLTSYLKIAFRNLTRNSVYSIINIGGLSIGMAAVMSIGLWIYDELSYNQNHNNYDRIAMVMQNNTNEGYIETQSSVPMPLANELRSNHEGDFKYVVMTSGTIGIGINYGDKNLMATGNYFEADATRLFTFKMVKGTSSGFGDLNSILISQSTSTKLFGDQDPINQLVRIDNKFDVKVIGVYQDFPLNSEFKDLGLVAPWELYLKNDNELVSGAINNWDINYFQVYVQLEKNANLESVSNKIKETKKNKINKEEALKSKPEIFLHPMNKWHLYSEFTDGVNAGGKIQFVWLFGTIGGFVLLLACINFMNLTTARSIKRSREVGIRKSIGSQRIQLTNQFFIESLMVVIISFALSLVILELILPMLNILANKRMDIPWSEPLFWMYLLVFILVTSLISGSYPAFYLSSFQPVKVLKGTFQTDGSAAMTRKGLVVLQFTVSVILITGVFVVYRQIQFAKDRPLGYKYDNLVTISTSNLQVHKSFESIRGELLTSGVVEEAASSYSSVTDVNVVFSGFDWAGKDQNLKETFAIVMVSYEFGKTVDWQLVEGRDFSDELKTDSQAFIINQAAVNYMGLSNPIGETIKTVNFGGQPFKVIGVVKDVIMESPYKSVRPTIFLLNKTTPNFVTLRLDPTRSLTESLVKIKGVFKKYDAETPFVYQIVKNEHSSKFGEEERIGTLATAFAGLAIFISCLGVFGLAAFMTEQRTKEIGIRKVMGASVFALWRLLSKDFIILIVISILIASPISYGIMSEWLETYQYQTGIPLWIFLVVGLVTITITLLTVSYQSIKTALGNPIKSLRTE